MKRALEAGGYQGEKIVLMGATDQPTNYPLAEVAAATGFADQSHLTRHFRHMLGTTPREFRWSQR